MILFVAPECDALCACHIITHMLRIEHIQYKIRPASGLMDLQNANETLVKDNEELRTIVLINCTGGFDITKVFPSLQAKGDDEEEEEEEEDQLQCFVIDSHRPIHLGNVYAPNVFVLDDTLRTISLDNLPMQGSDLSMNESSSGSDDSNDSSSEEEADQDGDDSDDSFTRKRKRSDKYRDRKSRRKVLNEYYLATSYGAASSMVAYEIAKETSKDTNDLLWLAIVGLTSYYVSGDMDKTRYGQLFLAAQIEVSSKNSDEAKTMITGDTFDTTIPVSEDGRISYKEDYRFMLYRHWNLYESMLYSDYVSTNMALWTAQGKKNLERLIAKVGIPLKSCRQKYAYMSEKLKTRLELRLEDCAMVRCSFLSFVPLECTKHTTTTTGNGSKGNSL